jgi:biopolymer transport protein TolR
MGMGVSGGGRGGRRHGRHGRAPMSEINVTPMVDVMLVLLIIFMVTAPLMKAAVPVELPDSRAKALSEDHNEVTISIARDGVVYVNEAEVAPGELADRLSAIPRGPDGKPPLVTLRGDKLLDYGQIMAVMGELNRAGFNSISLVTNASATEPAVSGGSGTEQ